MNYSDPLAPILPYLQHHFPCRYRDVNTDCFCGLDKARHEIRATLEEAKKELPLKLQLLKMFRG
jgi:hypothetical protein